MATQTQYPELRVRALLKDFQKYDDEMREVYAMYDEFEAWRTNPATFKEAKKQAIAYYKKYGKQNERWIQIVINLWRYRQTDRTRFDKIMRATTPDIFPEDIAEWRGAIDDYHDYTSDLVYEMEDPQARGIFKKGGVKKPAKIRARATASPKPAATNRVTDVAGQFKKITGLKF